MTGLQYYNLPPQLLISKMTFYVGILASLKKIKYRKNVLCWSINVKTLAVKYVECEEEFVLDPNEEIIGIFKEEGTLNKRYSIRGLREHFNSDVGKKKYEISKNNSMRYK